MGGGALPKQFRRIGNAPMLSHVLERFATLRAVDRIVLVIHPDDRARVEELAEHLPPGKVMLVAGGATRQSSVLAGLEALETHAPDAVLIHDGARPFVSHELCERVIAALDEFQGAVPALPVADTLKMVDDGTDSSFHTLDRSKIYGAQTPQGFLFRDILDAHRKAHASKRDDFTDDASIGEWSGLALKLVAGEEANRKITTGEDLLAADLKQKMGDVLPQNEDDRLEYRTGSGFDVHRFGEGSEVTLCGLAIPHSRGLKGHSDADVGLHALTDAVLGAIGDGDIGTHFPPTDVRWKNAASDQFLAHAVERVRARGGSIAHVDVTLICEAPKIGPHRPAMVARLSDILEIEPDRISVKATTTEGLGFAGRGEGIAAMASATVALPLQKLGA